MSIRCLLVIKDPALLTLVVHALGGSQITCVLDASVADGVRALNRRPIDLLILDERGLEEPGRQLLHHAHAQRIPVLLVVDTVPERCPSEVFGVVCPPARYLYQIIRQALARRRQPMGDERGHEQGVAEGSAALFWKA